MKSLLQTVNRALFQFSKNDCKLVRRTGTEGAEGQLKYPNGICVDNNGDVYVADCEIIEFPNSQKSSIS